MTTRKTRRLAALITVAGIALAAPAFAQDKTVKIGVLNDMSSLYADIGGPNSVAAAKMAVEDSGLKAKGWTIEVVSGDHQNKPDIGVNIARQWIDTDKVDAIADTPTSSVALAVSNLVKEKNAVLLNSGAATADLTGKACTPNTVSYTYDTYMLATGTGKALTKAGGDSWFFLTADYAFGHALERDTSAVVTAKKNLLSNAFKFTERGSVTLQVSTVNGGWNANRGAMSRAGGAIAFSVSDTGIGIPPENTTRSSKRSSRPTEHEPEVWRHRTGTGDQPRAGAGARRRDSPRECRRAREHLHPFPAAGVRASPMPPRRGEPGSRRSLSGGCHRRTRRAEAAPTRADLALEDDRANLLVGEKVVLIIEDDRDFAQALLDGRARTDSRRS